MGNVVYAKDAAGKIKETSIVERVFDLEEVKKFKVQVAAEKKKTQEEFNKRMAMIIAEEKKINEILVEAEKLGLIEEKKEVIVETQNETKEEPVVSPEVLEKRKQTEESVKAEVAAEEEK